MNGLQIFNSDEFGQVRTINKDGKILFCGNDVASSLGYKRPKDAIAQHCKGAVKHHTPTNGGLQKLNFIPEGDLYRLIVNSKLPSVEKFKRWVFETILPTIRETDRFKIGQVEQSSSNEVIQSEFAKIMNILATCPSDRVDVLSRMAMGYFNIGELDEDFDGDEVVEEKIYLKTKTRRIRHSKIEKLPADLYNVAVEMLKSGQFTYKEVAEYLTEEGHPISHTSVFRFSKHHFDN